MSFTSTSSGWLMAKATARANESGGTAWPQHFVHAVDHQERSEVVRRSAPQTLNTQVRLESTLPQYWLFNPAYAQVETEHAWSQGWMDITQNGMIPEAAADKPFKRVEEIFAKYPIKQA